MSKPSFFSSLLKNVPASASIAVDGKSSSEFAGFIDTGSYTLNAALSGSLFGGMADNKVLALAGESSTGKSYYAVGIAKSWLEQNPTGAVVYFDTESAITNQMLTDRGIDLNRVIKVEPETIEQFRQSAMQILENFESAKPSDRQPIFMILDSLGNLSSNKEVQDTKDQKDSRDMTKAGLIRGTFRVLRLKLAKLGVPMIVTNHIYAVVGAYVPTNAMSGGMGLRYCSDSIVFLSKTKVKSKDKKTVIGNLIRVKMDKSRLSRENSQVDTKISYSGGLDRYAGLLAMAEASGLVTKESGGRYLFPGHEKSVYESIIDKNPELYFTLDFLKELDDTWVKPTFSYGTPDAEGEDVFDVSNFEEVDAE